MVGAILLVSFVSRLARRSNDNDPSPDRLSRAPSRGRVKLPGPPLRSSFSQGASQQEIHMNPISLAIFVVFLLAAGLSVMLHEPLAVPVVLVLLGISINASLKMAQQ